MLDKLIDIHLNGDIDLQRIEKDDYDILYSNIVPDVDYNYAFLKNNKVNIDDVINRIKEDFKSLKRKPSIYVLSNIIPDEIESNNLELNHVDTWMVLDNINEYTTDLNIEYSRLKKEELSKFVDAFMINF